MSSAPLRLMLRHNRVVARRYALRHASTTSEATQAASNTAAKGKEAASAAASKASGGLSRVTSSVSGAVQGVSKSVNRLGGRLGRLVNFVQSLYPPALYYSKVGLELSKLVFQGRTMSPPSLQAFQPYAQWVVNALLKPSTLYTQTATAGNTLVGRIRNMDNKQWLSAGVVSAEVLGFYAVGEMIGRWKVVGYRSDRIGHGAH